MTLESAWTVSFLVLGLLLVVRGLMGPDRDEP